MLTGYSGIDNADGGNQIRLWQSKVVYLGGIEKVFEINNTLHWSKGVRFSRRISESIN
jgi:hypothetical protein